MKEHMIMSNELTVRAAYPTLDTAHSLRNVSIAMDKGSNEQPPKKLTSEANRKPIHTNPENWENGMQHGIDWISDWLKNNPDFNNDPEAFLKKAAGHLPQTDQDLMRQRKEIQDNRYAERLDPIDVMNLAEVDPDVEGARSSMLEEPQMDNGQRQHERRQQESRERSRRGGRRGRFSEELDINIPMEGITHPDLQGIIEEINASSAENDPALPQKLIAAIDQIRDMEDPVPETERDILVDRIQEAFNRQRATEESSGFYLKADDRARLMVDPQGWLDAQFDLIYVGAQSGQELDSEVLRSVQGLVGEANQFLSRRFQTAFRAGDTKEAERFKNYLDTFNRVWATRRALLVTRVTAESRNIEQIAGAYQELKASGLLGSMAFDRGRVGAMYNRMNEFMEDVRLAEGGVAFHITPSMVGALQDRMEKEQIDLAKAGVGVFADEYTRIQQARQINEAGISPAESEKRQINADEQLKAEVRRSIRTAYDAFVSSQRLAILAARGHKLPGDIDPIFTDPGGGFNIFNIEDFTIEKFGILNEEQREFMLYMQEDIAENEEKDPNEKLTHEQMQERGRRLFRDLFVVPDFYSSGWRVKGMLLQIEKVTRYKIQNREIVKGLVEGAGSAQETERFQKYLNARKNEADEWRRLVERLGSERSAEEQIAYEFVGGEPATTRTELVNGLSFEERTAYLVRHGLAKNKDIDDEVREKAKDLGLFLRLRTPLASQEALGIIDKRPGSERDPAVRTEMWEKVREYRPEEILRIVRERMATDDPNDRAMLRELNSVFSATGGSYDKFKLEYGAVIKVLREAGYTDRVAHQIDITKLNSAQREVINKAMRKSADDTTDYAQRVVDTYKGMQGFIKDKGIIKQLIGSKRYDDLYNRTIAIDDAILSDLEQTPANSGIIRLSEFWSNERGGDALKRNGNDMVNAAKAASALIEFITKEDDGGKLKAAEAFASATSNYNGPDGSAKAFRYTYGSYMRFALQDHWADILNIGKLPFRWSSSELERVFGPGQKPLTSEGAREKLDHVRSWLTGRHDHGKYYYQLENLLRADALSRTKDRLFSSGIYLLLVLMLVPLVASTKVVSESTK